MSGADTIFRLAVGFLALLAGGALLVGLPWVIVLILLLILLLVAWVIRSAVIENTGDPERDLFEFGVRNNGRVDNAALTGTEERIPAGKVLEIELKGRPCRLALASQHIHRHGRYLHLHHEWNLVHVGLLGARIGRKTFLRGLDRFGGSDCRFANAVTVGGGASALMVAGKDRDLLASLLEENDGFRLACVRFCELGYDEIRFRDGLMIIGQSYRRGVTAVERLDEVLNHADTLLWILDDKANAGRIKPPIERAREKPSSLFFILVVVIALGTGIAMAIFATTPTDLFFTAVIGGVLISLPIILRFLGITR